MMIDKRMGAFVPFDFVLKFREQDRCKQALRVWQRFRTAISAISNKISCRKWQLNDLNPSRMYGHLNKEGFSEKTDLRDRYFCEGQKYLR